MRSATRTTGALSAAASRANRTMPAIRAPFGSGARLHLEGRAGVDDSAEDGLAAAALHGQRLAGEDGFVQHGRLGGDPAVDGHHLARPDDEGVAGRDVVERNGFHVVADPAPCGARGMVEQRP
ncbi:hypothetical protein GCM10027068_11430 [Prescottella soli]